MSRHSPLPVIVLGPILYFRGEQGGRWRVSALFVLAGEEEPQDLRVDGVGLPVPPRHLTTWKGRHLWRFDFAVPRGAEETFPTYGFDGGTRWRMAVPGHATRLRFAFTSCNGAEDEATLDRHPTPRNALWDDLLRRHAEEAPFHLLLQGGDQLYADAVWREGAALRAWKRRPARIRRAEPFTAALAEEAMDLYFDHYLKTFGQAEVALAVSQIPSVMMWDDHDVFDGFGSLPEAEGSCLVVRGVALAARRCFALFQLGAAVEALPEGVWGGDRGTFTQGFRIGDVGILAPDLRSERTPRRVLSPQSWAELPVWLGRFAGCRHLLLMSSVPLLYADVGRVERLVDRLPARTGYEDDLRDQWRSVAHTKEWRRLLTTLVNFSRACGCKVTVLSGEVHLGGRAVLRATGVEIWQLISSGIVHPPPPRLYAAVLERLARRVDTPVDGMTLEMPPFAESGRRMMRQRNWLALTVTERGRLLARWHAEGEPDTYDQAL